MDDANDAAAAQSTLWNGEAGLAWVEAQADLDRMFQGIEALLVEAVSEGAAGRVLDVGCGAGGVTLALARRLGQDARCVGVDISQPMVAAARANAEREGAGAQFVLADAGRHAFEPASFDAIVSRFGVMFFDDPVRAFANLRRAARPRARLLAVAWRDAAENPFMTTAERAAAPLLPHIPAREPSAPGQFGFADPDRVRAILTESGWTGIDISPVDVACALPETALHRYITRMGPLGRILPQADAAVRDRVVQAVRAAFEPYVRGQEVRFTAACWMISAVKAAADD